MTPDPERRYRAAGTRREGWGLLLTPRWLGYAAFAIAFATVCVFLSHWQASRSSSAAAANTRTAANFAADPVPLGDLIASPSAWDPALEWRRVQVTGTFEPENQTFVRNRPLLSRPGFEVLTPLRLANGAAFLVARGWVQTTADVNRPAAAPAPPAGETTVTIRLRPGEPSFGSVSTVADQIQSIQLDELQQRLGTTVYTGAYGILDRYDSLPPATALTPLQQTMPVADQGMHLSYMIQWIIFALIGFIALGYGLRTEHRRNARSDPGQGPGESRTRLPRRLNDGDVEDALLDGSGSDQASEIRSR